MTDKDIEKFLEDMETQIVEQMDNKKLLARVFAEFGLIKEDIKKLNEEEEKLNEVTGGSIEKIEEQQRNSIMVQKIKELQNPSYLDEFIRILRKPPYTLPSNYFQPETGLILNVDVGDSGPQRYKTERMEDALRMLFPGSTTYRYGAPKKILCGQFSRNNTADLTLHRLSKGPVFEIDGRKVYEIKTLRTRNPVFNDGRQWVCRQCFSISDGDETCHHSNQLRMPLKKAGSNFPDIETVELSSRNISETKYFRYPLNQFIEDVSFLEEMKVGVVLTGFSRGIGGSVTRIIYDPYVGYEIKTKGILFKLRPLDLNFVEQIFAERHLIRDIIIGLIFHQIIPQLSDHSIPLYHAELFTSVIIKALELDKIDNNFDFEKVLVEIGEDEWVDQATTEIFNEVRLYAGRFSIDAGIIRDIFDRVKESSLSKEKIIEYIRELIINSISHALFIAGCTTSGSLYQELDYMVPKDPNGRLKDEIIVFDSANGSNGASQLIFDYLSLPEEELGFTEDEKENLLYRPRYLDETFAELLLPCKQGVIDRMYHQSISVLIDEEILRLQLKHLENLAKESSVVFDKIKQAGIQNIFPLGIGLRPIEDDIIEFQRESEKMREVASICIHGCPDCIALGNKSKPNQSVERYSISKYLLDILFKYNTNEIRLYSDAKLEDIEKVLQKSKVVILSKKINDSKCDYEDLEKRISDLIGKRIDSKFIKLSGKWFDCPITNPTHIEISYMMGLV